MILAHLPRRARRARRVRRVRPLAASLLALALGPAVAGAQERPASAGRVRTGLEVLLSDSLHLIRGKRVGLITNHSGRGPMGRSNVDLLFAAPGVKLVALYGPEHGIRGVVPPGDKIASSVDSATGVPVHSLYGDTRVPTAAMLEGVDVLVYDIQDVGARVYTYPWTLTLAAEAAKRKVIVLDRPAPIRADRVEGGVLDPKYRSFVGWYPVALRYGLTIGELARYLVGTGQLEADITVVPMQGYRRSMWWEETGLQWVNPSPNIRSVDAATLYPGTVYFEGTNANEGRGMTMPYQMVGAPWLTDAGAIARALNAKRLPGVVFDSTSQTVAAGYKFAGETVPVVLTVVSDRDAVQSQVVGLHLLREIYRRHPREFRWRTEAIDRLAGSDRVRKAVEREGGIEALLPMLERESAEFQAKSKPYWLYP